MNQPQQINISLSDSDPVTCNECGHDVFSEVYVLRKVSGVTIGMTQSALIPVLVYACDQCGFVNNEFLPQELQRIDEK